MVPLLHSSPTHGICHCAPQVVSFAVARAALSKAKTTMPPSSMLLHIRVHYDADWL
jgi:hypothetical protein